MRLSVFLESKAFEKNNFIRQFHNKLKNISYVKTKKKQWILSTAIIISCLEMLKHWEMEPQIFYMPQRLIKN